MLQKQITWIKKNPFAASLLAVIGLFVFFRIWRLSFPGETVFDEVYFPKMASQYLSGEAFFDIHPPLGKLIIAVGEILFGNTTLGWRIMPLLAGLALLPAAYWTSFQIFKEKRLSMIASFLLAIDGLWIVYSRTGLMDGFLILFGTVGLGFGWRFIDDRLKGEQAFKPLVLAGVFTGLAVAIKWIGAGFLPVVAGGAFMAMFFSKKRPILFNDFLMWLLSFVVIPAVLYTVPFLANWHIDFLNQFFIWHQQSWDYNVHLNATHPYASKWWSWPFLIRPIWFYYKGEAGNVIGVDAIGNPIAWWGSTLAIVYTLMTLLYTALVWNRPSSQVLEKKNLLPLLYLLAGWAAFYLPWVRIGRVLFLYHYMGSYLFAILLSAFWLNKAYESGKWARYSVIGILSLAVVIGLWFLPIWIAYPISQGWFNHLMWFKSWI